MEVKRFSHIWNEILKIFREEDLISNRFALYPKTCLSTCAGP